MSSGSARISAMLPAIRAVLARPSLWVPAFRQARSLAPEGWWRRAPFLPLPSREYIEFRAVTQYGDSRSALDPSDVVEYLAWCESTRRLSSRTP